MTGFVLAIDQGTTASKIHRLRGDGHFETLRSIEHRQIYPQSGWVEHDPEELVANLRSGLAEAKGAHCIAIANQGETVVAWDARDKRPIANAIVWQDARSHGETERLKAAGYEATTLARAGLPLDPYFSASKLRWILDCVPEAATLRRQRRLRLGTSDAFFLDRLAGAFITDVTTASRTSLMNLETLAWDPVLCDLFGVPMECLPEIRSTAGSLAEISGIPVTASVVDQQAALLGHGCRKVGDAKITFGTGAFALCVTGATPVRDSDSGLLPTVAWRIDGSAATYALDGGVYNAASAVNWARMLGLFGDYADIAEFPGKSALERNLVFVPALSGLACPHWDRGAAGMWLGLDLETGKADLMQALLEGVALRAGEVMAAMGRLVSLGDRISVDGGLSQNPYFTGFLTRVLGREVTVPSSAELTGLGTAQLGMIGAGLARLDTLPPAPPAKTRISGAVPLPADRLEKFSEAVRRCRNWR